jgi:hypothetical protein
MGQDTREKSDKEYIKISKEDFEKIYEAVEILTDGLDAQYHTLKYVYYLLIEIEMKLDEVLNKKLIEKIDMAISYIKDVEYDLEVYYKERVKPSMKILKKAKKEQTQDED